MIRSGEGLRVNTDALIRVTFRSGNRARDLSAYVVTGEGSLNGGASFAVVVTEATDGTDGEYDIEATATAQAIIAAGPEDGEYDIALTGTDLAAEGTVALEFTFAGAPTINAPARPLFIPVRSDFQDAP